MARNRMLNPEFWLDEEVATLSAHARLLYMGLWGICDDNYATLPNKAGWIKAQIFPYENVNVENLLKELSDIKKIILFNSDGQEFWHIKNFFKHQRVDRPSNPKYAEFKPQSEVVQEDSSSTRSEVKLSKDKLSQVNVSDTPAQSSKSFFYKVSEGGKTLIEFIEELHQRTGVPSAVLSQEVKKFHSYWTELDSTGKRQRWQKQETFEVQKRFGTWLRNAGKFNGASAPKGKQII